MARSTRTSLAGQAASAARRIVKRRPAGSATDEAAGTSPAAKTSTAKNAAKNAAKKASEKPVTEPAKKAATKTAATKTATSKTATSKAAASKAPAKKSPAKKAPAKKAPAKKASTVADKTPAKKVPAAKPATTKTASAKAPAKKAATTKTPAAKAPTAKTPAKKAATKAPAKKAPTKKAPVSALVVKEDEEAWTKAELAEVLAELHEQREHSARIVAAQEAELSGLMRDSGDGAGQDQADLGATSFERDHELTVLNNERDKLAQIERALLRIDDGSYGRCESCGNPIGKMRLMAFPRATLCMPCKQREERR